MFLWSIVLFFVSGLALVRDRKSWGMDGREAFLFMSVGTGAVMVLSTALLSAFDSCTTFSVRALWGVLAFGSAAFAFPIFPRIFFYRFCPRWYALSLGERVHLIIIALILVVTFVVAYLAPVNTWDVLTYHASRVMHWAQNQGVRHYPTDIVHQLNYAPGAEYLVLQLYLLAGDDRWMNVVQWFSMLGSLVGVSLIAKYLGIPRRGQLLSALVAATIPMGILQSNSAQTDYVVTLWIVCVAAWAARPRFWPLGVDAFVVSAAFGLAVLTKGTAFIALGFLIWGIGRRRSWGVAGTIKILSALVAGVVVFNIFFWAQNMRWQPSHEIFPEGERGLLTENFSGRSLAVNGIRQMAVHFSSPWDEANGFFRTAVESLTRVWGVDLNDSRETFSSPKDLLPQGYVFNEDVAANTLHLLVGVIVCMVAAVRWPWMHGYLGATLVGGVLMIGLIKWQPWISRFHLPLFVLVSPVIAAGLVRSRRWVSGVVAGLMVVGAVLILSTHNLRPLVGKWTLFNTPREVWYFAHDRNMIRPYLTVSELIRSSGCRDVGLAATPGSWEYPLWALANKDRTLRMHYVAVDNFSREIRSEESAPCLLVALDKNYAQVLHWGTAAYLRVWEERGVQLYRNLQP